MASTQQAGQPVDVSAATADPETRSNTPTNRSGPSQNQPAPSPSPVSPAQLPAQPPRAPYPTAAPQEKTVAFQQHTMGPLPAPYQPSMPAYPVHGIAGVPPEGSLPASKSWTYAKLALNTCAFVSALVVFALTCVSLADRNSGAWIGSMAIITMPISIPAIGWTLSELITFTVRNGGIRVGRSFKGGIHPGAHVALHLVLWLAWIIPALLAASRAASAQREYDYCTKQDEDDSSYGYGYGYSSSYCGDNYAEQQAYIINSYIPQARAMTAFAGVSLVCHFALFVGACVDTHKRNQSKRRVVFVPGPPPPMMMPPYGGWQQHGPPPPPPGMTYSMMPAVQPFGGHFKTPDPSQSYQLQRPQQPPQQSPGIDVAADDAPTPTEFYAPTGSSAAAAPRAQPGQVQPHLGGYYAPSSTVR